MKRLEQTKKNDSANSGRDGSARLSRLKSWVDWFLDSNWFMLFAGVIVVLSWALHWEIAGPVLLLALACFILLFREDLTPLFVLVCLGAFSYFFEEMPAEPDFTPAQSVTQTYITTIVVAGCVTAVCLVWYLYKHFIRAKRKPNFGKLWMGMAIAGLVSLLSGVLNPDYDKINMLTVFAVGFGVYLVYFLIINCTSCDLRRFACKIMMFAGFVIVAEMLIYFSTVHDLAYVLESKRMRIGWGMTNSIATLLLMAIPATLYLCVEEKHNWALMLAAFIFGVALLVTMSRGNLLFGVFIIPAAFVYAVVKSPYRRGLLISAGVFLVLLLTVFLIFRTELLDLFSQMLEKGFDDNSRFELWEEAWQRFLANPIFGCGYLGYEGDRFVGHLWKVHCTPLQILSSAGVVGVIGFVLFYFQRYRLLFKGMSVFKFFAFLLVAAYELYGFMDLTFFIVYQIFFVFLFLGAAEKETPPMRKPFRGIAPSYLKINMGE